MTDLQAGLDADLIVIGLGAMGAATAYHAANAGLSVIGIDQFDPPHTMGSTHAETRITRLAVGEGPQYLPFVARSHEIWRELEALAEEPLLHQTGGLLVTQFEAVPGQRWEDFTVVTKAIADEAGIEFSVETPADVRRRHPLYNVPDHVRVGFEPTGGLVMAERAVAVQLAGAGRLGADIRTGKRVEAIRPDSNGVDVLVDGSVVRSAQVVVATGPWIHDLGSAALTDQITISRQVVYWFEVENLDQFGTDQLPWLMWIDQVDEDYVGIFPSPPNTTPGLKALGEQFLETTTPADVDRSVSTEEVHDFYERLLEPKVSGVLPNCLRAEVCLYANTKDDHFIIDRHPDSERVMVMSPCSGHGFKHSTALGEAVAQTMATGASNLDLSPFGAN